MIDWKPIDTIPDDRKDGRNMLLWTKGQHTSGPDIGTWEKGAPSYNQRENQDPNGYWEALYEFAPIHDVTHWADITAPI